MTYLDDLLNDINHLLLLIKQEKEDLLEDKERSTSNIIRYYEEAIAKMIELSEDRPLCTIDKTIEKLSLELEDLL